MNICKPTSIDANKIASCDLQVLTAYQFELLSKRDFSGTCPTPPSKLPDDSVGCAVCFSNEIKAFLGASLKEYNDLLLESETLNPLTTQKTNNFLKDMINNAETLENETSFGFKSIINHPVCRPYSADLSSMESKGKKGLIATSDFFNSINTATIPGMKDEIDALIKLEDFSNLPPSSNPTGLYAQDLIEKQLRSVKLQEQNFENKFKKLPEELRKTFKDIKDPNDFIVTLDKEMSLKYGKCLNDEFSPSKFEAQLKKQGFTGNKASGKIYTKLLTDADSIESIDKELNTSYSFYSKKYLNKCKKKIKKEYPFMREDYKQIANKHYSELKTNFKKNIENIFYKDCSFSLNSLGPNPTKPLCLKAFPENITNLDMCKNHIQAQKEFIENKMSRDKETLRISLANYEKVTNAKLSQISEQLRKNVAILKARFGNQDKLESISIDTPAISFSSQVLSDFDLRDAKSLLKSPSDFFKNDQGENLTAILMKKINDISGSIANLDKGIKEAQESVDQVYNVVLAKMQSCQSSSVNKSVDCANLSTSDQQITCDLRNQDDKNKVLNYCNLSTGTKPTYLETLCGGNKNNFFAIINPCQILKYLNQECHIKAEGTNVSTKDASISTSGQTYSTSSNAGATTTQQ